MTNLDIKLIRKWFTARTTVGELFLNGEFFCYTLEKAVRAPEVYIEGETSVPIGEYELKIDIIRTKETISIDLDNDSYKDVHLVGDLRSNSGSSSIKVAYNKASNFRIYNSAEKDLIEKIKTLGLKNLIIENKQENE